MLKDNMGSTLFVKVTKITPTILINRALVRSCLEHQLKTYVTPRGDTTAFVQRSKHMSARCGVAAKCVLNIKFAS